MRLWRYDPKSFSPFKERVVYHCCSQHWKLSGVKQAYAELARRLSTDQWLFCYTISGQREPSHDVKEWILEVPEESILTFIDNVAWNRILGMPFKPPCAVKRKWETQAAQLHPSDGKARRCLVNALEQQFREQPAPTGSWWNALMVEPRDDETVDAVVKYPFDPNWDKTIS